MRKFRQTRFRCPGFTLVELLIVIAIVGTLIGLLLPAIHQTREASRRATCASQIRQLGIATDQYELVSQTYPAGVKQWYFNTSISHRGIPLFAYLLPFMEQGEILFQWDYGNPLQNANQGAQSNTAHVIPALVCPSDLIPQNPATVHNNWVYAISSYGGNGGTRSYFPQRASADGIFHTTGQASEPQQHQRTIKKSQVTDGLSHTFLFGERSHTDQNFELFNAAGWGEELAEWGWWGASTSRKMIGHVTMSTYGPLNYRLPFSYAERGDQNPAADSFLSFGENYGELRLCAFGSNHPAGANFTFADGSTRFLHNHLDDKLYKGLSTRAGGEGHREVP